MQYLQENTCVEPLSNKVAGLQVFSYEYCKIVTSSFLLQNTSPADVLFYIIFSKTRCWIYCSFTVHTVIVSFWNLKLLSFAFIRCTTVFIRCATRCYSSLLIATCCHSLSLVVTRCTSRCHSLSFVVTHCGLKTCIYIYTYCKYFWTNLLMFK